MDRLDRLFQSFSQVDTSTTRKHGGTGLGLAISKRLATLMDGQIWVESVVDRGSTFHFTIPLRPAPPQDEPPAVDACWPGTRMLIVDDNETNRRILAAQVSRWQIDAVVAATPRDALEMLRGQRFDVGLFDYEMPEMNGVELARHATALGLLEGTRLILSSSTGISPQEMLGGGTNPFKAFLIKPTKLALLRDTIGLALGGSSPVPNRRASTVIDTRLAEARPLRILVAEDNAVNQKVAVRLLERMGYRPDVASNGVEALDAVHRQPYDVVLMDVHMPEMDGLEASRRIATELAPNERPRLIALTANALKGDRQTCIDAGMDDYLAKPLDLDDLRDALLRCG